MINTVNHSISSTESDESDDAATNLINILSNVLEQCRFNDYDFDHLLAAAARRHIKQLVAEQIEERSLS